MYTSIAKVDYMLNMVLACFHKQILLSRLSKRQY